MVVIRSSNTRTSKKEKHKEQSIIESCGEFLPHGLLLRMCCLQQRRGEAERFSIDSISQCPVIAANFDAGDTDDDDDANDTDDDVDIYDADHADDPDDDDDIDDADDADNTDDGEQ